MLLFLTIKHYGSTTEHSNLWTQVKFGQISLLGSGCGREDEQQCFEKNPNEACKIISKCKAVEAGSGRQRQTAAEHVKRLLRSCVDDDDDDKRSCTFGQACFSLNDYCQCCFF
ncbi:Uncharacterized protein TSPI_00439 [Trichinella spiralis]|uniref:Uncharacterized protein n=2 Tax=Trichinella spiralis TaxID=6334 RepID=A0ABR3KU77_TRISP|nr:hypothetical protein Tsp_10787 [Trichinella spiralis]KRY35705.1 hypothetical protein T01_2117 [Trichinella spiralis]